MRNKHENILQRILPIPHGFDLVAVENNTMLLIRKKGGRKKMETKHETLQKEVKEQSVTQEETVVELVKTTFKDKTMYTVKIMQGNDVTELQFGGGEHDKARRCYGFIIASDIVLDRYSEEDDDKTLGEALEKDTPVYKVCGECGLGEKLYKVDDGRRLCLDCIDDLGMIEKGS